MWHLITGDNHRQWWQPCSYVHSHTQNHPKIPTGVVFWIVEWHSQTKRQLRWESNATWSPLEVPEYGSMVTKHLLNEMIIQAEKNHTSCSRCQRWKRLPCAVCSAENLPVPRQRRGQWVSRSDAKESSWDRLGPWAWCLVQVGWSMWVIIC